LDRSQYKQNKESGKLGMSTALSIYHGRFGRATLYRLNRPMTTHAHREGHLTFLVRGAASCVNVVGQGRALSPEAAVAVNPWEPHDFRPGDQEHGSLFLVLYIKPVWFLEFGRSAQYALRFGRNEVEMTSHIRAAVNKVTSLLAAQAGRGGQDQPAPGTERRGAAGGMGQPLGSPVSGLHRQCPAATGRRCAFPPPGPLRRFAPQWALSLPVALPGTPYRPCRQRLLPVAL
jgi:hypothetical protein